MSLRPSDTSPDTRSLTALVAMEKDTEMIRHALYWLSTHPELTPFASVLGKYAVNRAMNACLGPKLSHSCKHCLKYVNVRLDDAGMTDIMNCSTTLFYREVMAHPIQTMRIAEQSLEIAKQSLEYITHAIHTLANLPQKFQEKHSEFAHLLWSHRETETKQPQSQHPVCPVHGLTEGMRIYNKGAHTWGDWLHMGLPNILSELQKSTLKNEKELEDFITKEYDHWRLFGQNQVAALSASKTAPLPPSPQASV